MIKLVKLNKLFINFLLVGIFCPCVSVSKRNNEISMQVKTLMCQTRNCYLHNEGRQSFPRSARSFDDIPAMTKLIGLTEQRMHVI